MNQEIYDKYIELNNLTYQQLDLLKQQATIVRDLAKLLGIEGDTPAIDRKGDY